ncbi:MAG: HAD-IG family 5'-nucleotidase [Deltaproteobacteria bacterium]|nr:HAD-IG family 5'-nucleotidase [Deltaproteobacteria bacterium]
MPSEPAPADPAAAAAAQAHIAALVEQRVPYPRRVFCNRNLRLDRIRFIGFDMDYTLARYTEQMEHLQSELVLERMVDHYGYDRSILAATYDPRFAIRGLTVDKLHGNVFKMNAHRFIGRVWHGAAPLDPETRKSLYTNRKVSPRDDRYVMVDTLFSLPEISLYCQLVAAFDAKPDGISKPTYARLWDDLRSAMDSLHRDGTLKAVIRADLARFIEPDPELAETLHRFRSAGKKLFILTNSEPDYTEAVMSFLLDGRYPGYARWRDYFEFVLTSGRKPTFFSTEDPFLDVSDELVIGSDPSTVFRRGGLYAGGNLFDLTRLTGMIGDDVLYVGDHIYGDILRSKMHTHWRTAMVVQEMERELTQVLEHRDALDRLYGFEERRFQLDLELTAKALDGERDSALRNEARNLGREIARLSQEISDAFNPTWGMLFRDRAELSAFGAQSEDYACVYTSRVSNFRLYSPQWYFRSPRDRMAHELRV